MYISQFRFFLDFYYQGGVKSTVSGIFEDLNLKISEDYIKTEVFLSLPCHVGCLSLAEGLILCSEKKILGVESRDLSQTDTIIKIVSSFQS
jgi:hypothetical protein